MEFKTTADFSAYMQKLIDKSKREEAEEPQGDPCHGCCADEDEHDDTDSELAAMTGSLSMIDNAEDLCAALAMVLMVVSKKAGLGETSQAAHALWLDL